MRMCRRENLYYLCANLLASELFKRSNLRESSDLTTTISFIRAVSISAVLLCPKSERTCFFMKKNIYIMYTIALLQGMVFYGPIATLYRQAQGVSVFQITLIESISLILCLLLEIPWGVIADRIGYKLTMVLCCGLYFISKIVFWQATGFWWFLLERIMLSVVIAGLSGVDTSILYLSCDEGKSLKAFGIYNSLQTAGLLIAAVCFSAFIGENYKLAGGLTAVSYGLAAMAALWLTEVKPRESHAICMNEFEALLKQTMKTTHLLLFLVGVAFLSEIHQTITVFLNQIQYEKCGLSASVIGYVYIAVTLAGLCGVFSARLSKKTGTKLAGALFYSVALISCVVLAFTGKAESSIGGILMLRISNSLFQPFQLELQNKQIFTSNRATALSINAMIIDSIGAGTNLAFGALAEVSLSITFLFGAGLCVAGLLLFFTWYRSWSIAY